MVLKTEGVNLSLAHRTFWCFSWAQKNKKIGRTKDEWQQDGVLPAAGWFLGIDACTAVRAGVNCCKRFLGTPCLDTSVARVYSDFFFQLDNSSGFFIRKSCITIPCFVGLHNKIFISDAVTSQPCFEQEFSTNGLSVVTCASDDTHGRWAFPWHGPWITSWEQYLRLLLQRDSARSGWPDMLPVEELCVLQQFSVLWVFLKNSLAVSDSRWGIN